MKFLKLNPRYNSAPIDDDRAHGLLALNTTTSTTNAPALAISGFYLSGVGALAIAIVDGTGAQITASNPLAVTATFTPSGTQDVNLTKVGGTTFALGQQLASASLPVVLTAAQITTLTPLSTVAVTQSTSPWVISGAVTNTVLSVVGGGTEAAAQRVTLASDSTGVLTVKQATGTNLHVVLDTTSTTAVTQATASNLNATVVGTGTFVVQATLAAETTKVIGVTRTADGAGNLLTSNSTTYTAKFGLDSNLLGTLGTAFSTAGKVDVKAADGDVFVRSNAASTFPTQATLQTQTDTVMVGGVNIKEINAVTPLMGNGTTGTGSQRVTIASDNTPFPIKIDQTTPGTTNAISLAQIGATTIVNGGTAGSISVGGMVANNGTINSAVNPILVGGQAVSSENAANTTAKLSQFVTDLVGKLIVLPYANPENFVSGAITSAMTGTTSTSLLAAPAAGLRNYITTIVCSNSHATVGTDIIIQDGSGGTTLMTIPAAAIYGGAVITLPTPLRQPTTATAIFCANVTTGASTKVSAVGYKGI